MIRILEIPGWHPTAINRLYGGHWSKRSKLKSADAEQIAIAVKVYEVPAAETRRRVRLHLVYPPGERMCDPDASWKSLLDGLVKAAALKNDSPAWVVCEPVTVSRGEVKTCFVTVEDVQ